VHGSAWVLTVLAMASACGNGLEPEDVAGSYTLVTVNESALPALLPDAGDCEQLVDVGELQLTSAGSYFIEFWGPLDCDLDPPQRAGRVYVGSYQVSSDELRFETVLAGGELLQFSGEFADGQVRATVPPIPPLEGPDLLLGFGRAPD
jgi:hypothetical protein